MADPQAPAHEQYDEARHADKIGVSFQPLLAERERFQRVMHYQTVDKIPNFEFGYWAETLPNWHKQGLPEHVVDWPTAYEYFGIQSVVGAPVIAGLQFDPDRGVIEETETRIIEKDIWGAISEVNREGNRSIPRFLHFPVKDRETWRGIKGRLLDDDSTRFPPNWPQLVKEYRRRDYPLGVNIGSLIGVPRNLIGFESICMMVCEEPEFLEEIVEDLCQAIERNIVECLKDVQYDYAAGWEDICFNSGPIVGVPFFRDVVAPRFKRICDILHLYGVDIVFTDCDGNMTHILPFLLDAGVNTLFPTEVNAGTDPVLLRRQYGKELRIMGGVNKMILMRDKKAVDDELMRLRPIVEEGGFIPHIDHMVTADARLDLYKHYQERKREWFNVAGEPKY